MLFYSHQVAEGESNRDRHEQTYIHTHCWHHTAIEQTFKKNIEILLNVLKIDQIFFNIKFLFTYKL